MAAARLVPLLLGGLLAVTAAHAAPCDTPKPIRFAPGTAGGEVEGGIARGEIACLTIGARAGQRMQATVTSAEDNVVLQIYRPVWKIAKRNNEFVITGGSLPGTAEGADARSWSGLLPASGTYLLVLGTIRGGGAYRLSVAID